MRPCATSKQKNLSKLPPSRPIVYFRSLARSKYLFRFSLSSFSSLWSTGNAKYTKKYLIFFLLINTRYHYHYYDFYSFTPDLVDGSHGSLRDCKSPQVSPTLLNILVDLINAVVWMVFTRPLISKFSCPCTNPLVTVLSVLIITGVTFMFDSFFSSLASSWFFSIFLLSFSFTWWLTGMAKSTICQVLFF